MIISKFDLIIKKNGIQNSLSSHSLTTEPLLLVVVLKVRLVFVVFSVPGIGGFFGTATHKGIKHYSLRDKRDFDDEENESLRRKALRDTHTGEEGYFVRPKKISQRKKRCVWRIFFPLFFRVLLV